MRDDVGPTCSPHLNKTAESASGSLRITPLTDDHVAQLPVRENQSTGQGACSLTFFIVKSQARKSKAH